MNNDDESFESSMTTEEIEFKRKFDSKVKELDTRFQKLGMKNQKMNAMFDPNSEKKELTPEQQIKFKESYIKMEKKLFELPTIDSKGREILSNQEIHKRYNEGWPILRYKQLPVCWYNYKAKLGITLPLSFMGAYAYQVQQLLSKGKKISEMKTKGLLISWGILYGVSVLACTVDSLYQDDYCDINSYHYNLNQSRKSLMRDLRKKLKPDE